MAGSRYIADSDPLAGAVVLDGLTLVFHSRSGATHLLVPPAPQILEAVAGRGADVSEIIQWISDRFEIESEDAYASISARLTELEAAGLVWRT